MAKNNLRVQSGRISGTAEVVRDNRGINPGYSAIDMVSSNISSSSFAKNLSYEKVVADSQFQRGIEALDTSNALTKEALSNARSDVKSASDAVSAYNEDTKKNISILEKQRSFFNAVTQTNILANYNDKMFQAGQDFLNENPDGKGYMQYILQQHDDYVSKTFSSSLAPELKQNLNTAFHQLGVNLSNKSFTEEQTRLHASAELEIDKAVTKSVLQLAQGQPLEDVLQSLDPLEQSIPDNMTWKEKAFKQAKANLIEYSFKRTALLNPSLAKQDLLREDGYSSFLSQNQVTNVLHTISAKEQDIQEKQYEDALLRNTSAQGREIVSVSELLHAVHSGKATHAMVDELAPALSPEQQAVLHKKVHENCKNNVAMIKKDQALLDVASQGQGAITALSPQQQNTLANLLADSMVSENEGVSKFDSLCKVCVQNKALRDIRALSAGFENGINSNEYKERMKAIKMYELLRKENPESIKFMKGTDLGDKLSFYMWSVNGGVSLPEIDKRWEKIEQTKISFVLSEDLKKQAKKMLQGSRARGFFDRVGVTERTRAFAEEHLYNNFIAFGGDYDKARDETDRLLPGFYGRSNLNRGFFTYNPPDRYLSPEQVIALSHELCLATKEHLEKNKGPFSDFTDLNIKTQSFFGIETSSVLTGRIGKTQYRFFLCVADNNRYNVICIPEKRIKGNSPEDMDGKQYLTDSHGNIVEFVVNTEGKVVKAPVQSGWDRIEGNYHG